MKISALESHGFDQKTIALWDSYGHKELLPIQEKAVTEAKVLNGENVVVFSPTSSGKTFVAEMAAIRMALKNRRVIYLVPQKALAEEKYEELKRKYSSLGIRVMISTRDRQHSDERICGGNFHIVIAVYEKMQGLLIAAPNLLSSVGLVIVDELQMMGDPSRGAQLELLLTKIKLSATSAQIIGLSAVLGHSQEIANWLNATLCQIEERPVELRKGVIFNDEFRYVEHNSRKTGTETFGDSSFSRRDENPLFASISNFVTRGEQCIVFCKKKSECVSQARMILDELPDNKALNALSDLLPLEASGNTTTLTRLLQRGVAFHNTDLSWEQRSIIERHFRTGEIKVIFATTTLALGLNLPAKNVFVDTEQYASGVGRPQLVPITQAQYENISGRAGRYGLVKEFGRSIIVTNSPFDARVFFDVYANGHLDSFKPALADTSLSSHVLNIVASGLSSSRDQVRNMLLSSYTGQTLWRGGERESQFTARLDEGIRHCLLGGVLEENGSKLTATDLGRLAATKGISIDTAIAINDFIELIAEQPVSYHLIEVLLCLANTEDGEASFLNMSTDEYYASVAQRHVMNILPSLPAPRAKAIQDNLKSRPASYERMKALKKTIVLHEWARGVSVAEIEQTLSCPEGTIQGMAEEFAWLAEAFTGIAKLNGWTDDLLKKLSEYSLQIKFGVPSACLEIMSLRARGIGRERVKLLLENGLDKIEKVGKASRSDLAKLLTPSAATALLERIKSLQHEVDDQPDEVQISPPDQPDIAGASAVENAAHYGSKVKIWLIGRAVNKRLLVKLNGHEVFVRPQQFAVLLMLAMAATKDRWVNNDELADPETCYQVISRLKKDLLAPGVNPANLIENNSGQYRLSVPPKNIRIDKPAILAQAQLMGPVLKLLEEYEPS